MSAERDKLNLSPTSKSSYLKIFATMTRQEQKQALTLIVVSKDMDDSKELELYRKLIPLLK